ncbi:MAG: hypothetical protein ACK5LO_15380 [Leucobacter sp.]
MSENSERNAYRIIVFIVLIVGGVGFFWLITQNGTDLGNHGIFQFFTDPAGADPSGADPSGAEPTSTDPSGAEPSGTDPARDPASG